MIKLCLSLLSSCLIFSSVGLARGHEDWQGNWLIGLTGSWVENKAHLDLGLVYTAIPNFPATYSNWEQTDSHYEWEILGGYQLRKNGWIFGAELNVIWQGSPPIHHYVFTDVAGNPWSVSAKYKERPAVGLSGRVGYEITPYLMPYLRLGLQRSRDDLDFTTAIDPSIIGLQLGLQEVQWKYHTVVGFGAELPLYTCLVMRLEYNYLFTLKNQAMEASSTLVAAGVNPAVILQTHPRSQMGKISLVWNFA